MSEFEAIKLNLAPKPGKHCPNKKLAEEFRKTRSGIARDLAAEYGQSFKTVVKRVGSISCKGCDIGFDGTANCTAEGRASVLQLPGRDAFSASSDPEKAAGFKMEFSVDEITKAA